MASFGRYIQVTLGRKVYSYDRSAFNQIPSETGYFVNESSSSINSEELALSSDLKTKFNIKSDGSKWTGSVKVYNLSERSSSFPYEGFVETGKGALDSAWMRVDAGYAGDGNHGIILECMIYGIDSYKSGTDTITEFFIGSSVTKFHRTITDVSINRSITHIDAIKEVLELNDIEYECDLEYPDDRNEQIVLPVDEFIFSGTLSSMMDQYLSMVRYYKFVEYYDEKLGQLWHKEEKRVARYNVDHLGVVRIFWEDAGNKLVDIVKISPETGIISINRSKSGRVRKKIKIKHILSHQILRRSFVDIVLDGLYSDVRNGRYIVRDIEYKGSNYNGTHEVTIEVSPVRRLNE